MLSSLQMHFTITVTIKVIFLPKIISVLDFRLNNFDATLKLMRAVMGNNQQYTNDEGSATIPNHVDGSRNHYESLLESGNQ